MPVTVKSNLPKINKDMVDFLDAAIRREGFSIERDMKSSMKGQGSGAIYVRAWSHSSGKRTGTAARA